MNPADRFSRIQQRSGCIYARQVKVVSPQQACLIKQNAPRASIDCHIRDNLVLLRDFCKNNSDAEGFVYEFHLGARPPSLHRLMRLLHTTAKSIYQNAGNSSTRLYNHIATSQWEFEAFDCPLFVSLFSSTYSAAHPRSTAGLRSTFIFLQKESSFDRLLPDANTPENLSIRRRIRWSFQLKGQSYDWSLSMSPCTAYKMLKPLTAAGRPVAWWRAAAYA